jgi:HEAT repeat protein
MREEIASFLSQNPLPDAKPALLEALKREWRSGVLLALARALLPLSGDHDYTPDDPCLWSDDIGVRLEGVVELWRAHTLGPRTGASDKAQLDEWRDAIEHHLAIVGADVAQPEMVRGLASMVLGCIGSDFARLTLLEAWQKGGLSLLNGWCVAEGLARINHPEVEDAVLAVADTRRKPANPAQELQQVWAFFILGWVGTQQKSAGLLFRTIKDKRKSVKVRGYAANAIGRLQPPEGRHRLEEALNQEEDAWVLKRIVQALGRAGTMESIPLLEQYLRSGRVQVRYTVRYAISSIRQRYELV